MKKIFNVKNDCSGMLNEEIIDTIFKSRGIFDKEHFLNPTEDDMLPLEDLERIDEAAKIVVDGILNGKKFMVYADVDADGITSGAIGIRYLRDMGAEVDWYINEGKKHGVTEEFLEHIKDIDILIIVDSLNNNVDLYKQIKDMGIKTIVLDHHDIDSNIPYDDYVVLVSSNRESYKNKDLSGAGVVMKFCLNIDAYLGTIEADKFYDLCAIGLLADMMSVDEKHMENRYLISKGLKNMHNPAVKKIVGSFPFNSKAASFSIAPLINASMRYNENKAALELFLSDDNKEVLKYLRVLKKCKERQAAEVDELLPSIIAQCEAQADRKMLFVVIDTENGIAGLLGNKLLERYKKPIVCVKDYGSFYLGSARAPSGRDFKAMCVSTGLGEFDGHPNAHGVKINVGNIDKFRDMMDDKLKDVEFVATFDVDIKIGVEDISSQLIDEIKKIDEISGTGFKSVSVKITTDSYEVETMSQGKHLVIKPNNWFQFIKWNAGGLVDQFEDHAMFDDELSFVGSLDSGFLGRNYSMRMIVDDIIETD